jgi:O-antigen ligase
MLEQMARPIDTAAGLLSRDRLARLADGLAIAVATALPWSTSATLVLLMLWLPALIGSLRAADLRREIDTMAGALPLALWALAGAGMLWATAPFAERLEGFGSFHKLLAIPLLMAQFRRSDRGVWVLAGFLASCTVLLLVSWSLVLLPGLPWRGRQRGAVPMLGIPVKDYIAQSMVFTLCLLALLDRALNAFEAARRRLALALTLLALAFLGNILYVATSRTALVALPLLLVVWAAARRGWRLGAGMLVGFGVLAAAAWPSSSFLQHRVTTLLQEIGQYRPDAMATSAGQRLDFWRNSLTFIAEAPVLGHGTGAIREQYRRLGEGSIAQATNPHNQTIAVALQLGLLGVAVLYAMWAAHLRLFLRIGPGDAIGLLVVAQSMLSSLFNSSLFDFTHGWVYVWGVGVLAGMAARESPGDAPAAPVGRWPLTTPARS